MRLFFHLRKSDGDIRRDDEGADYASLDEAYLKACREIPEMVAEFLRQRTDPMNFRFEVTDEAGRHLIDIPFRELAPDRASSALRRAKSMTCGAPRSASAGGRLAGCNERFHALAHSPIPCVFLSPDLVILEANGAFRALSERPMLDFAGLPFFDAFPDRFENHDFAGRRRLKGAFERTLTLGSSTVIEGQRYDVQDFTNAWQIQYWSSCNWPIFDGERRLVAIASSGKRLQRVSQDAVPRSAEQVNLVDA